MVEKIVRHECGCDCCIDAIGRVMRQSSLNRTTLDHQGKGWIDTNWRGAHSCAALLAGRVDVPEKLLAVIMNGVLLVTANWNGPHKWVILRMTPTTLLSYLSCKKHQGARASLVVDASGRGSRTPQWLASLGYRQVEETSVRIDVGYASRIYRCPDQLPTAWKVLIVLGPPPDHKRAGVIFPIEGGYWMVTLGGWLCDYPPDDDAGFLEYGTCSNP